MMMLQKKHLQILGVNKGAITQELADKDLQNQLRTTALFQNQMSCYSGKNQKATAKAERLTAESELMKPEEWKLKENYSPIPVELL